MEMEQFGVKELVKGSFSDSLPILIRLASFRLSSAPHIGERKPALCLIRKEKNVLLPSAEL